MRSPAPKLNALHVAMTRIALARRGFEVSELPAGVWLISPREWVAETEAPRDLRRMFASLGAQP